jgi:hypothetical protein
MILLVCILKPFVIKDRDDVNSYPRSKTPVIEDRNDVNFRLRSVIEDCDDVHSRPRSKTPVIEVHDDVNSLSHPKSPVVIEDYDDVNSLPRSKSPVVTGDDDYNSRRPARRHENHGRSRDNLLIKQGKQIRALYELQKLTIQNQVKKQNDKNKTDLSQKSFQCK